MKDRTEISLVLGLVFASVLLLLLHFAIFHDSRNLFFYTLLDICFIPVQVALVSIVIDRLISGREKKAMLNKLNMVIGAFFSEVGAELLRKHLLFGMKNSAISSGLQNISKWTEKEFVAEIGLSKQAEPEISPDKTDLPGLKVLLKEKRVFVLGLLQNPNLLEHETFTELLWALCHLTEELEFRKTLFGLPGTDADHLSGDIKRVYKLLITEWLAYLLHLKKNYPYLFSLASRTNPFNPAADPTVR